MAKVLLVEDDQILSKTLSEWLLSERHLVDVSGNGKDALELLLQGKYDIVILDWNLPDMDGLEVLKRYRSAGGNCPILMLTGKGALEEKEQGLDWGADDYLAKPAHVREVSARVRALLRRPSGVKSNILTVGELMLDSAAHRVTKGGNVVPLTGQEFALLEFFMRHPGEFFTADTLLSRVWRSDGEPSVLAVRVFIKRLREKLDCGKEPSIIQNERGLGYRLQTAEPEITP
jgi:DNA-binding response OmpR family regulator